MAPADRLHILLLPLPTQGHINPMLHFASSLVSCGCSVTFLYTQRSHKSILNAHRPSPRHRTPLDLGIRFVAMPDRLPSYFQYDSSPESLLQMVDEMQEQQGILEELVENSRTSDNPISCIVSTIFCPSAQDVARKAGLPGVMYWAMNATLLHVWHLVESGQLTREVLERDHLDLGSLRIDSLQILSFFFPKESGRLWTSMQETVEKTSHILVNSFEALEDFLEPNERLASKMRYIGPCLPGEVLECKPSNDDTVVQESLSTAEEELRTWLDSQGACSVLFISFGSIASFSYDQIEQIALGVEESKQKFLWVARQDATCKSAFPEGFMERTREQGRVIPWAQQLQVLQHPAVGGFMTHCGWNSTLESISMGVPMLCLPLSVDQPVNEYLIVKQWQAGLAIEKDGDGNVRKEYVETAVRRLMGGDEGSKLRARGAELKEAARVAFVGEGGLSFSACRKFLHDVREDIRKSKFENQALSG